MQSLYWLLLVPVGLGAIFFVLAFINTKINYDEVDLPLLLVTTDNGQQYFRIQFPKWQLHKMRVIRSRYPQNTLITTTDGFTYKIVSYKGCFSTDFVTNEIRFGLELMTSQIIPIVQNITISITDSANIDLKLDNTFDYMNAHAEIQNKIENVVDKEQLLSYIDSISKNKPVTKESTSRFYSLIKKYEPILSCATNLISAISSIISVIK